MNPQNPKVNVGDRVLLCGDKGKVYTVLETSRYSSAVQLEDEDGRHFEVSDRKITHRVSRS